MPMFGCFVSFFFDLNSFDFQRAWTNTSSCFLEEKIIKKFKLAKRIKVEIYQLFFIDNNQESEVIEAAAHDPCKFENLPIEPLSMDSHQKKGELTLFLFERLNDSCQLINVLFSFIFYKIFFFFWHFSFDFVILLERIEF